MKELGRVQVEPKSLIHKMKQKLGLAPKELMLSIDAMAAETTLEIVDSFQKIKAMERETSEGAFEVMEANTPLFIHLISVAARDSNDIQVDVIKRSIRKHWSIEEITLAINVIYESIDFGSMFQILAVLGKIKSMVKTD